MFITSLTKHNKWIKLFKCRCTNKLNTYKTSIRKIKCRIQKLLSYIIILSCVILWPFHFWRLLILSERSKALMFAFGSQHICGWFSNTPPLVSQAALVGKCHPQDQAILYDVQIHLSMRTICHAGWKRNAKINTSNLCGG